MTVEEMNKQVANQITFFLTEAEKNELGLSINGPALLSSFVIYCIKNQMDMESIKKVFLECCEQLEIEFRKEQPKQDQLETT